MATTQPARHEIQAHLTWDLTQLFPSDASWEEAFQAAAQQIEAYPAFEGTLKDAASLYAAIHKEYEIALMLERLFVYARMRRDEDNAASLYQGMTDRAMQQSVAFGAASAFLSPEILALDPTKLDAWIDTDTLAPYRRVLQHLVRGRAHTLSAPEERLLALAAEPLEAADTIFTMLNDADLRFGTLQNAEGETVELTHGTYRSLIESQDRRVRENAYTQLYGVYMGHKNTLAAAYASSVKADVFAARARKHESSLHAALFGGDIPLEVYDGLLEAVESHLPALGAYLQLRRSKLGLDTLHMYDLYVPIVEEVPKKLFYEEAKALVKAALAPLGKDYAALLERAYTERWIDVCENRGKTSGAYSWGAYGTHPYVLLNYQNDADYAFTLAHELGHAMHTYYSDAALPYQDAQYKIMAAEVASTVNENLLLHYMLQTETDEARRAYLLNHHLEQFRTTVFRQTMFAAFERNAHLMCENGEPLTVESLCALYGGLNEAYYPGVVVDEQIRLEWARIPHFYRAYYVYQYATGFCAAVKLTKNVLAGGEGLANYLAFLKSGGSDYPITLLRRAGVDLKDPGYIHTALDTFAKSVEELAALLA